MDDVVGDRVEHCVAAAPYDLFRAILHNNDRAIREEHQIQSQGHPNSKGHNIHHTNHNKRMALEEVRLLLL